ncbi:MAG: hypothetical protein OYH76_23135 [Defluviicoccus sp.]|nr:hypothetical protein [Defluviicoccus sp.]MDE0278801.1 hypothetical protein [Defluviicoccus sp.]
MPAVRLTQRRVDALRPRRKVRDVRDAELKGYGVRMMPSRAKRYFIHTQHRRRRVWKTVGNAATPSEAKARAQATFVTRPNFRPKFRSTPRSEHSILRSASFTDLREVSSARICDDTVACPRRPLGTAGRVRMAFVVRRRASYDSAMTEAIAFDTHRFVKRLTDCGFTEQQAETLAAEHVSLLNANVATKLDFAELRADLLKWMIGLLIAQGGLIVALVRLL